MTLQPRKQVRRLQKEPPAPQQQALELASQRPVPQPSPLVIPRPLEKLLWQGRLRTTPSRPDVRGMLRSCWRCCCRFHLCTCLCCLQAQPSAQSRMRRYLRYPT